MWFYFAASLAVPPLVFGLYLAASPSSVADMQRIARSSQAHCSVRHVVRTDEALSAMADGSVVASNLDDGERMNDCGT